MEKWAQIGDTNYSVSSNGLVRNDKTGKNKAQTLRKDGYNKVDIYDSGERASKRVHRLVAEAFIPNPDNKPQINHIDGNKLNNDVSNLEWSTCSENMLHAYEHELVPHHSSYGMLGKKNPNAGAKGKSIRCVETGDIFKSAAEAERLTGIPDSCIFDNLYNKCSHAHGYHFEFL